jgi:hypothetical protein
MKTLKQVKTKKDITDLERIGVVIEFEPLEEDINIFDQFDNEKDAQKVADRYNAGNMAAWFCAHVTVKYRGMNGDDYLGCCSYKDFADFTQVKTGFYYPDMINQSINQINREIMERNAETNKQLAIRTAKNLIRPYGYSIIKNTDII